MGEHKEIADIKDELEYIRAFIEHVDIQAESSHVVKIWVKQVLEIVECIEDVIEKVLLLYGTATEWSTISMQKFL